MEAVSADFSSKVPNTLVRVIFHADLRCGHDGLTKLAKSLKVNVTDLKVGEFVAFINNSKSAIKLYAAGQTIAYYRNPGKRQLNLKVLSVIPRFFNGKELQYNEALKEIITKEIKK